MSVDSLIDPGSSLGELVAERPARTQLFEQLRLDYCCGGHQTLAAACAKRGLELEEVNAALQAIDERGLQSASVESRDWRKVATAELCAHIVRVHHEGLREAFPRIERLLATVVRVHGDSEPAPRRSALLQRDPKRGGAAPGQRGERAVPGLHRLRPDG